MSWNSAFGGRTRGVSNFNASTLSKNMNKDIEKYLYVQAKLLNFIELAYNEGKIDKTQFQELLNEKMQLINGYKARITNFDAREFIKEYDLESQTWVCHRLTSQNTTVEEKMSSILKVYDKANNFMNLLETHETNPQIGLLKGEIYDLLKYFRNCQSNGYFENSFCSAEYSALNMAFLKIDKQNMNDMLTSDEFDTLTFSTDTIIKRLKDKLNLNN